MFIRFKRVKLASRSGYLEEYSLHAVLVENHRDNQGRPRQQIIAYLGSIRERQMHNSMHRSEFLRLIQDKLRQLSLSPREMSKIQINLINNITHKLHIIMGGAADNP